MTQELLALDTEQLKSLRELNEPGEPDLVTELIDIFIKQSPETLEALHAAVKKNDSKAIEKMAHKLKGSCANLGAEKMRSLCQKMEERGRIDVLEDSEALYQSIFSSYKEVIVILEKEWRIV